MSPSKDRPAILLRLPADLREALNAEAREQHTTLNQLCVAILAGAVGYRKEKP